MTEYAATFWFFPDLRALNPYQELLYKDQNIKYEGGVPQTSLNTTSPVKVFHVHWEHYIYKAAGNIIEAGRCSMHFLEHVLKLKQNGWFVYWTIHNLEPHENRFPSIHAAVQSQLADLSDKVLCHSEAALEAILEKLPDIRSKIFVLHHPPFKEFYSGRQSKIKPNFEWETANHFKFLFFGSIRDYKGLSNLLNAFKRCRNAGLNVALVIAGEGKIYKSSPGRGPSSEDLKKENIFLLNRRVQDEEVHALMKSANAMVLPYKKVLTSGAYILARDYGLTIIIAEEFIKLQDDLVQARIFKYRAGNEFDLSECLISAATQAKSSERFELYPPEKKCKTRWQITNHLPAHSVHITPRQNNSIEEKGKTLVCILHYEREDLTKCLFESLSVGLDDSHELIVIDNGSSIQIDLPCVRISKNIFFGGALNLGFSLIKDNPKYDSLLFLNNDLIVNGHIFVKSLRNLMTDNYKIVSPSIIQPSKRQCFWPTMWNWGSPSPRPVPWADFVAPLIHRDVIEKVDSFSSLLKYGWGNDIYTGMICEDNNWNICVTDTVTAVHLGSETVKSHASNEYRVYAELGMTKFFESQGLFNRFMLMRRLALSYRPQEVADSSRD